MSTAADIEARMLLHVQYALARICLDECVDISVLFDQVSDHLVTSMQAKIPTELALLGRVKELQAALDAATAERDAARAALQAGIDAWMSEHPHAENAEELAFLWREFVACDEAHLAPDARALRHARRSMRQTSPPSSCLPPATNAPPH